MQLEYCLYQIAISDWVIHIVAIRNALGKDIKTSVQQKLNFFLDFCNFQH